MCNLDETNENIRKRSIVYKCEHLFNNFRQDYANKLKICIVAKGLATSDQRKEILDGPEKAKL